MKKILCGAMFCAMALSLAAALPMQAAAAKYTVYCTNGKTEVDMRTPAQMKSARGGSTYPLATFDYRTDADNFAKKMNRQCPKK